MSLSFGTDLTGKVAVVTGAGGVLCGMFAKTLAEAGAKVALLDRNIEAAQKKADEITANGGIAKAYQVDVLDKNVLETAHNEVLKDLGKCDILLNGAGGNSPRATTEKEYFEPGDIESDTVSFFDLDQSGVEFVFNLNFLGTLLPTQVFAKDMIGREGCNILNVSSMNAFTPLTKIPAYSGAKGQSVTLHSGLRFTFRKAESASMRLHLDFSLQNRMKNYYLMRRASRQQERQRFLRQLRWDVLEKQKNLMGRYCIC